MTPEEIEQVLKDYHAAGWAIIDELAENGDQLTNEEEYLGVWLYWEKQFLIPRESTAAGRAENYRKKHLEYSDQVKEFFNQLKKTSETAEHLVNNRE